MDPDGRPCLGLEMQAGRILQVLDVEGFVADRLFPFRPPEKGT
jgi:hypothetical protein